MGQVNWVRLGPPMFPQNQYIEFLDHEDDELTEEKRHSKNDTVRIAGKSPKQDRVLSSRTSVLAVECAS